MTLANYVLIKSVHISSVLLSLVFFISRFVWQQRGSALLRQRWVRVLPHVIDTVLLASALTLAVLIHQYPFHDAWLTAKLFGLLTYIVCGQIALRMGRTRALKTGAFILALAVYGWIVSVAISHQPAGYFEFFSFG